MLNQIKKNQHFITLLRQISKFVFLHCVMKDDFCVIDSEQMFIMLAFHQFDKELLCMDESLLSRKYYEKIKHRSVKSMSKISAFRLEVWIE